MCGYCYSVYVDLEVVEFAGEGGGDGGWVEEGAVDVEGGGEEGEGEGREGEGEVEGLGWDRNYWRLFVGWSFNRFGGGLGLMGVHVEVRI